MEAAKAQNWVVEPQGKKNFQIQNDISILLSKRRSNTENQAKEIHYIFTANTK
jgi:hypothetical protein